MHEDTERDDDLPGPDEVCGCHLGFQRGCCPDCDAAPAGADPWLDLGEAGA